MPMSCCFWLHLKMTFLVLNWVSDGRRFQQPFSLCLYQCVQWAILQSVFKLYCTVTHLALFCTSFVNRCLQKMCTRSCPGKVFPFSMHLIISKLGCGQGIATSTSLLLLGLTHCLKSCKRVLQCVWGGMFVQASGRKLTSLVFRPPQPKQYMWNLTWSSMM